MSHSPYFIVGTPPASWLDLTAALPWLPPQAGETRPALSRWLDHTIGESGATRRQGSQRSTGKPVVDRMLPLDETLATAIADESGGVDARAYWALDTLAQRFPEARFLLVIDHPARAACTWLAQGGDDDPAAMRALWTDATRRLVGFAQQYRDRCLLVVATEARADPAAFVRACQDRIAWPAGSPRTIPPADIDPLGWALGDALSVGEESLQSVFGEALLCSLPLGDGAAFDMRALRQPAWDERAAIRAHRERRAALPERDSLATLAEQRQHEILTLQASLDELDRQARQQQQEAAEKARTLSAQLSRTRRVAQESSEEAARLLVRLHQVYDELEHYHSACEVLQSRQVAAAGASRFSVERTEFGPERLTAPHLGIDLALHGLEWADRSLKRLDVRLVHHRGRPGLLIFDETAEPHPLGAWHEDGQEGARPFTLLVPADAEARQRLLRYGAADWQLITGIAYHLEQQLREADHGPQWHAVAGQLSAVLRALPPRLRYDGIRVAAAGAESGALDLRFENVHWGAYAGSALNVRWWPEQKPAGPDGSVLQLCLPSGDGSAAPLPAWPLDESGRLLPIWSVPVGRSLSREERRLRWSALGPGERDQLLAVLDALPAAAPQASAAMAGAGDVASLAQAARDLLREARAAIGGSQLRRLAQALRRASSGT